MSPLPAAGPGSLPLPRSSSASISTRSSSSVGGSSSSPRPRRRSRSAPAHDGRPPLPRRRRDPALPAAPPVHPEIVPGLGRAAAPARRLPPPGRPRRHPRPRATRAAREGRAREAATPPSAPGWRRRPAPSRSARRRPSATSTARGRPPSDEAKERRKREREEAEAGGCAERGGARARGGRGGAPPRRRRRQRARRWRPRRAGRWPRAWTRRGAQGFMARLNGLFGRAAHGGRGRARASWRRSSSPPTSACAPRRSLVELAREKAEAQRAGRPRSGSRRSSARRWSASSTCRCRARCEGGGPPHVVMVVGVNGAGKTTTIGKLAAKLTGAGQEGGARRRRHLPRRRDRAARRVGGAREGASW